MSNALAAAQETAEAFGIQDILALPDRPLTSLQATLMTSHPSMQKLANLLAVSGMVPKAYEQKPGAVLVAINTAMRLGMDPLNVMQALAVINGQPRLWGNLPLALVMRHPDFEDHEETLVNEDQLNAILAEPKWTDPHALEQKGYKLDEIGAKCVLWRRKRDGTIRQGEWFYSIRDAIIARLWGKVGSGLQATPWVTSPKRMLHFRARGFVSNDLFPDALLGFVILGEHEEAQMLDGNGKPPQNGGGAKVVSIGDRLAARATALQGGETIEGQVVDVQVTQADEQGADDDAPVGRDEATAAAPTAAGDGAIDDSGARSSRSAAAEGSDAGGGAGGQGLLFDDPSARLQELVESGQVSKARVLKLARKHIDPQLRLKDLTAEHHPVILAAIDAGDEGESEE